MTASTLLALALPALAGAAASSLQFVPASGGSDAYLRAIPFPNGDALIVGRFQHWPGLFVLDSAGNLVLAFDGLPLGSGNGVIEDAAIDPGGDMWITGTTDSDDFPLVHPLFAQKAPYRTTSFVAKLDSHLNILFSTFLGGTKPSASPAAFTAPTRIALDSAGNTYIAGFTSESSFPVTGPVFGTGAPGESNLTTGLLVYTFITGISADGSKLLYSRLLGGDRISCALEHCLGDAAGTTASSLVVDANGNVTIAGETSASNFPVTPQAFQAACNCLNEQGNGFVARISADGSKLVWSSYLGSGPSNSVVNGLQSLALDPGGNIYTASQNGFVAKISSDGTTLMQIIRINIPNLAASNLQVAVSGMTLDATGNVWIDGTIAPFHEAGSPDTPASGNDFVVELSPGALAQQQIINLAAGTMTARPPVSGSAGILVLVSSSPAFDSAGRLLLLSSKGSLLRLDVTSALTAPAVFALVNAAALAPDVGVTPGEIATFFGVGLGPPGGMAAVPDAKGFYPTQLGGVKVQFQKAGGPPPPPEDAPLLYVGPNQINFQVPWDMFGNFAVTVATPTATLAPMKMNSISSTGIFQQNGSGFAAALNQDNTVNSSSNPARFGSTVTVFATGICGFDPLAPNGAVWKPGDRDPNTLPSILVMRSFSPYDSPLPVLNFGFVPGVINGVCAISVQVPPGGYNPVFTVYQIQDGLDQGSLTLVAPSNTVQVFAQ